MTETGTRTDLVTVAEAADLTGLDNKTLTRKLALGEIPFEQKLPGRTGAYLLARSVVVALAESLAAEAEERARGIREALEERAS